MATRERPIDRGRAKGKRMLREFADEFRAARRAAGLSQLAVARASGISRSSIERLELDRLDSLTLIHAAELAAIVGLDLAIRAYPGPRPVRDAGQIRLLRRLQERLGPDWEWTFEVPLDLDRDQRAWDARATHRRTGMVVVIEAVTRITDTQSLLRRLALKRRDGGSPRLVLLLADTRTNAAVLRLPDEGLTTSFPVRTRDCLEALMVGRDPGHDAIVVL